MILTLTKDGPAMTDLPGIPPNQGSSAAPPSGRPTRQALDDLERQLRERDTTIATLSQQLTAAQMQLAKVRGIWRTLGDTLMDGAQ